MLVLGACAFLLFAVYHSSRKLVDTCCHIARTHALRPVRACHFDMPGSQASGGHGRYEDLSQAAIDASFRPALSLILLVNLPFCLLFCRFRRCCLPGAGICSESKRAVFKEAGNHRPGLRNSGRCCSLGRQVRVRDAAKQMCVARLASQGGNRKSLSSSTLMT